MAGRRTSLASLAGAKVDDVPGRSDPLLLHLPLSKLVPTRFNPRRNFGTEQDLLEFGQRLEQKQLQPAVVVSRAAYLKLWPEEDQHVGDASYVIANGERRYRGSRAAGRATLAVVHDEEVATSRATFLDAVLSENTDREDLDPIERALGIQTMVEQLGGKAKVAEYYSKSAGWVTQQTRLLDLVPELQALVSSGELPLRETRELYGLPPEQQVPAWEARLAARESDKARPRAARTAPAGVEAAAPPTPVAPAPAEPFTAVKDLEPVGDGERAAAASPPSLTVVPTVVAPAGEQAAFTAVKAEPHDVPEPRAEQQLAPDLGEVPERRQIKMPWANGAEAMKIVFRELTKRDQRAQALTQYVECVGGLEQMAGELASALDREERAALIQALKSTL